MSHAQEVASGERFRFGRNWARFLELLDPARIAAAESSLREMFELPSLEGASFLDIGCGSGLFSLAARRLGARVVSFDYDPDSVACARELRGREFPDDPEWTVAEGSVLDEAYVGSLGRFDLVYSWGVLHHTGDMWRALRQAARPVGPGGKLFIAIYNDQGVQSTVWKGIKRLYCTGPAGRALVTASCTPAFLAGWFAADVVRGRSPLRRYLGHAGERGMNLTRDLVDWLGGYPFEVASPEAIFDLYRSLGFRLARLRTVGGSSGNNEFVFARSAGA